ncbi:Crp/Fnr family transcriptional regulator [Alteromonas aestuariivivens]|uniref:Crp/Fnr family transcriptional regulator n=1 Tax=Alteromonas aestuariivivens TaxID=1938339 RepID=A0A3D8M4E3_9ALTE|nr:Crp/Fnr family transcriptional regulator [Alteromonas aestuariivivens]RDV24526.1 Crp/Fnr family transcriptional regulator [Alteromonas aestuariivivens]
MSAVPTLPVTNDLINCLANTQRKWLLSHSTPVELEFGQVLNATDAPIENVYFPLTGFISVLMEMSGERSVELGLIGSEGMLGATLALGKRNAPMQSIVQGTGKALRMNARSFRQRLKASLPLRNVIHSYLYVLIQQLSLTGACNCSHEVPQRLARWLLMTQDRAHASQFYLTHQYLARMLGVRRSAVTIAAGAFQRAGLISYSRGQINVLSRSGLKHASCQCYVAALNIHKKNLRAETDG